MKYDNKDIRHKEAKSSHKSTKKYTSYGAGTLCGQQPINCTRYRFAFMNYLFC